MRAYRAVDRFDGRYPRAWLLTILRNTWRNMNRRVRPQLLDVDEVILSVPAAGADGRSGAEEHVLDGVLDVELANALRSLSHNHRSVVLLVDVDGLTYQEAADMLAIPPGTVMSRLHRARKRLRRRLSQRLSGDEPMRPRVRRQWSQMSCRQVGRLLHAYLDNELNDARAVLLADHLHACLRCGLDASSYRWLKAQLADLQPSDDQAQLERLRGFADQLSSGRASP